MTSKLWCGGGEEIAHSSVPTSQGFSVAFAPAKMLAEEVEDEDELGAAEDEGADARPAVEREELRQEGVLVGVVEPPLLAGVAGDQLAAEDQRDEDDAEPEVHLAEGLVHLAPEHLGEPEVDRRERWPGTTPPPW